MKQFKNKLFASVLCMVLIVAMALSMTACTNNNASDDANAEQVQVASKSFTFEVIVKPYSTAQNSVFIAKGDTQAALKTKSSGSGIEFFIYDNGSWKAVETAFPSGWVGNWHQVVGVYDKGAMSIYVDGVRMATNNVSDSIASSKYPVVIG